MALFKKAILATALAASALAATSPAEARGYYRHGGGDGAAIGIGAGILGLALGAAIASDHHDRYRDRDYYQSNGYYYRDGYYWDRQGHRYDRDEMLRYRNGYRGDYRQGYYGDGYRQDQYRQDQYRDDYRRGYNGDEYYRRGY